MREPPHACCAGGGALRRARRARRAPGPARAQPGGAYGPAHRVLRDACGARVPANPAAYLTLSDAAFCAGPGACLVRAARPLPPRAASRAVLTCRPWHLPFRDADGMRLAAAPYRPAWPAVRAATESPVACRCRPAACRCTRWTPLWVLVGPSAWARWHMCPTLSLCFAGGAVCRLPDALAARGGAAVVPGRAEALRRAPSCMARGRQAARAPVGGSHRLHSLQPMAASMSGCGIV